MRVFSQINNCQQKQNKKQKQKTDKTKREAPLLGLAKSIYYFCLQYYFWRESNVKFDHCESAHCTSGTCSGKSAVYKWYCHTIARQHFSAKKIQQLGQKCEEQK